MMKKEKTMKRRMLYLLAVIPVIGLMSLLCANNANAAGLQSETGSDDTDNENVINILIYRGISYQLPDSEPADAFTPVGDVKELGRIIKDRNISKAIIAVAENEKLETLSEVKDILRENNCLNIVYQSVLGTPLYDVILRAMGQEPERDSEGYAMVNGRRVTKVLANGQEEAPADFIDEILEIKAAEQKDIEEKIANDEPLMLVENMPEFPGGSMAMMQYLSGNIKYPEEARDNNIQGRVIIQFVVEKDGSISNVEVIKSVHELLDSEALRCVSAMPAWTPGTQRGKPIRVSYTIPINFKLNDSDSDFKSVRVSYMKEMNVALFKSCKAPANAAVTVTPENLDNAIDDVINGRREFFEMDYSNYSSIQDALGNHGIDRIKYSADK